MMTYEIAVIDALTELKASDFTEPIDSKVFGIIGTLYRGGLKNPSYVEVLSKGQDIGLLKPPDVDEVSKIVHKYITEPNLSYWIERIQKASKARALQTTIQRVQDDLNAGKDVDLLINQTAVDIIKITSEAESEEVSNGDDLAREGIENLQRRVDIYRKAKEEAKFQGDDLFKPPLDGIPTGFDDLDEQTLGYMPGDLILLGAETGHGKTGFALNTANGACVQGNYPLLYLNTEMNKSVIARRWGGILSGIEVNRIKNGSLTDDEVSCVVDNYARLSASGFYSVKTPNLTPARTMLHAQRHILQYDIKMLIVDYVGRMQKTYEGRDEWQVLEQIVRYLKQMAQNLNIAIMCLVQLNKDGSLQGAKRMKNETDLMLNLKPMDPDEKQADKFQKKVEKANKRRYEPFNYYLEVDKNRDGETGKIIPIVFNKRTQQIRQAKVITNDWTDLGTPIEEEAPWTEEPLL